MSLPELFGPYLLHHRLARGTTSEVFLAQTTGDYPRLCAVKRLHPEVAALPELGERFRRDASLLVRLIHGNLVQTLEVGAVEERPFIAMESIDGVDLPELISQVAQQGALPPELALYVGLELCEALAYLELRRPEHDAPWSLELMIGFDGVVKVIDLGSFGAVHLGQQPVKSIFRSPGYSVPEVICKRPMSLQSELFALGLSLWEMLEGRRLVASEPERYVKEVLAGSWEAPMVVRKDVPGDIIRLVVQLLQLDPERRPRTLDEVRRRIVESLRRLAPSFGSASVSQLLRRRCADLYGRTEAMTSELLRRARTDPGAGLAPVPTLTYGHARDASPEIRPAQALQPGDAIPGTRYRMVRWLGRGASAEVCAAQHIDLERQVAFKILSPAYAANADAIAQFRLEARACGRIGHPNIVDVVDFGELTDGRFFFAMELLEGQSLAEVIWQEKALSPARCIGIFRQIARAVQSAHHHAIIHRDLKAENVMLVRRQERDDFVKVLDFGVMAFAGEAGDSAGTPGYMAPEQIAGARPTPAMDVYAIGAMLYEALSGELPYPAPDLQTYMTEQASRPPPVLRSLPRAGGVPPALERVVHRALQHDPAARHASMEELERDLLQAQQEAGLQTSYDDLPAPGMNVNRRRRGERRRRQRPWPRAMVFAIAAGTLVLGLLAGLYLTREARRQGPPRSGTALPARAVARSLDAPAQREPSGPLKDLLRRADEAVSDGLFSQPAGRSALDLLRRAEREFPREPRIREARQRIARTLEGAGDRLAAAGLPRSARTLYDEARLFDPGSTRLAEVLRASVDEPRRGRKGMTDAASGGAVQREPGMARLAWLLSRVQLAVAEGRYLSPPGRNALEYLVQVKQLDPNGQRSAEARQVMTTTLRKQADALWRRGELERAFPIYRLVLALDPADRIARVRQPPVEGAAERGKPAPPETADPRRAGELITEGRRLLGEGDLQGARRRFQAALQAQPRSAAALAGLASVAFEEGGYPNAVLLARQALAIDARHIAAQLVLGDASFNLHRHEEARRAWEQVLTLDPGNRSAKRRLEKLDKKQAE